MRALLRLAALYFTMTVYKHCGDFSALGDARKSVCQLSLVDVLEDGVWWKLRHCSGGSVQPEAEVKTGQSQHTGRVLPSLHFQS